MTDSKTQTPEAAAAAEILDPWDALICVIDEVKDERDKWRGLAEKLAGALEKTHHALANAQEWYISDPEDSEMDRDQQMGNWVERAFDAIKEARAEFEKAKGE